MKNEDIFLATMMGMGYLSQILLIIVFFVRFRYVRKAKLHYWCILVLLDFATIIMALLTASLLNMDKTQSASNFRLFANILLIFDMGLWLLQYQKIKQTNIYLLWAIFIIFIGLWFREFSLNHDPDDERLRATSIFLHFVIFVGSWLYLFEQFKNPLTKFRTNPAFWLVVGWLFFYTLTSTIYFKGITKAFKTNADTIFLYDWTFIAMTISNILYIIAFWKTKEWVLKNRI